MYAPEEMDLPVLPSGHAESQHPVFQRMRGMFGSLQLFPDEQVRRARAAYYGLITYLDDKVGRLLGALEATGQLENTLVIYTSDHGEMNGEHGMWRKSNFYEQSARVPLILAGAGVIPEGRVVEQGVSLVDVVVTMGEGAGARSEEHTSELQSPCN